MTDIALPEFRKFASIPRLLRDMIVTEKIDGTNAQVCVLEDGRVLAGSRNRWITPEDDNYGFARWVKEHEDELREGLGVGQHFGEWWGQGIQRGYGLTEKRFSLFNVGRWYDRDSRTGEFAAERRPCPACCFVVPVLWSGPFSTLAVESLMGHLEYHGSKAAYGFMRPEGVVVYHVKANQYFKVTLGGDGHKSASR